METNSHLSGKDANEQEEQHIGNTENGDDGINTFIPKGEVEKPQESSLESDLDDLSSLRTLRPSTSNSNVMDDDMVVVSKEADLVEYIEVTPVIKTNSPLKEEVTVENSLVDNITIIPMKEKCDQENTNTVLEPGTNDTKDDNIYKEPKVFTKENVTEAGDTVSAADTVDDENSNEYEWVQILGHDKLRKKVTKKGNGYFTRPTNSQIVTISCHGTLEDGIVVEENQKHKFTLGDGDVIQAFDLCVPLMELGECCILETDSQYAYGKLGRSPDIPADAHIQYELELLEVEDPPLYNKLPITDRLDAGKPKRERGNWWYSRGDHISAITSYNRALHILSEGGNTKGESEADIAGLKTEQVKCYNNLGACQLKLEAYDAAIKSCDAVLRIEHENVKALFRKGKCLAGKGELELAITSLRKAIKIEPETKLLHTELSSLVTKQKKQSQDARAMYQRMLGTDKASSSANDSFNTPWMLYVGGAVAAACVSVAVIAYRYMHF